jgi:phosphoglycolate phosphatase
MQATIKELQLPERTDEQCAAMIGLPLTQCFTDLYPDFAETVIDAEKGAVCAATYRRLFDEFNEKGAVPLFPHVHETLQTLHQRGIQLTIASSRSHMTLDAYVRDLNLSDCIQYILGVEDVDVKEAKPGPGPVLKTLRDFGLQPEECIVVGDTKYDIQMAHNAGVRAVGVTYGNGSREEMEAEKTEWIIDDFAELLDIV